MSLIRLENLTKTYHLAEFDVPVLKGISLDIQQGEYVSLMGASGSGKSTLMNILGCLDHPSGGKYFFEEEDITRLSANQRADIRNRKIGFVFQSFNLLRRTSALDNVMLPLAYAHPRIPTAERRKRALEMLDRVGLSERVHHHPSQLSGGQQQRVAIARALINRPPILFADEPTGNLDSKTGTEVLKMFKQLNKDEKITIIVVTHDPHIANEMDRVIHIHDGIIVKGTYQGDENV